MIRSLASRAPFADALDAAVQQECRSAPPSGCVEGRNDPEVARLRQSRSDHLGDAVDERLIVRAAEIAKRQHGKNVGRALSPAALVQQNGRTSEDQRHDDGGGNHGQPRRLDAERSSGALARSERESVAQLAQVASQIARRGVPVVRRLRQTPIDDLSHLRRKAAAQLRKRRRFLANDCRQRLGVGPAIEWTPAGEHLVENHSERELIGTEINHPSGGLLRRHV